MYNMIEYTDDELYHYGVKGMKWGVRRANRFTNKARIARASAKEWDEIGAHKSSKLKAKGNMVKAEKVAAKYKSRAMQDRTDAKTYENRAKAELSKQEFRDQRSAIGSSRSLGAKVATNLWAGPFANRTYNSVLASGGSRAQAIGVTTATAIIGGPIGHLVVSTVYTSSAAEKSMTRKR